MINSERIVEDASGIDLCTVSNTAMV
jgi:hypothetical protein